MSVSHDRRDVRYLLRGQGGRPWDMCREMAKTFVGQFPIEELDVLLFSDRVFVSFLFILLEITRGVVAYEHKVQFRGSRKHLESHPTPSSLPS